MGLEQERFSVYGKNAHFIKNNDKTLLIITNHENSDIRLCYTLLRPDEKYLPEQLSMHQRYLTFIDSIHEIEKRYGVAEAGQQSKLTKLRNTMNIWKKKADNTLLQRHAGAVEAYYILKRASEEGKKFAQSLGLDNLLQLTTKIDEVHGNLIKLAEDLCKKQEERIGALYL